MKSNILYDEQRIKVAQEALSGTKLSYLARKYSVSPSTITNWVKFYKERFGEESLPSVSERIEDSKRLQELETKMDTAIKLLGEKDLEIELLRELLKKSNPAYKTNLK
ncbi:MULTISPECIES: helix-turn-helix domain-containing protein [Paenibacillus]|jgi:transposase-like protein|nr:MULTISPECIES: helix-turn-helix domain-containing protein [Paenibacillus]MCY9696393.1 helix-turn-helix domain-containing protein [Paenibacillus alginolyticus]MEC0143172.1 helix-turn-helix domain-containing protein [Paenibacillus alginolyticus]MEC0232650.1 helix-turn-helix domain-containing protein [Paenibacillus alba]NQX64497.1 helix-turn-helix domain-containing protein [Paenibacillus alba]